MRKLYVAFVLVSVALLFTSLRGKGENDEGCGGDGPRKSAGPPPCYCNEPPTNITCATGGCHSEHGLNTGPALLKIDLGAANNGYMPGQSYTITVSVSKPGLVRSGFQLLALQDNDLTTTPGEIIATDLMRTQIMNTAHPHSGGACPLQNRTWIEHTGDGIDNVVADSIRWQFTWNAPANPVGTITFYVTAVDANFDLDNTGDYVHAITKTIASLVSGVNETEEDRATVFPNPANTFIQVKTKTPQSISITNVLGEVVSTHKVSSTATVDVSALSSGVYYITNSQNKVLGKFVRE